MFQNNKSIKFLFYYDQKDHINDVFGVSLCTNIQCMGGFTSIYIELILFFIARHKHWHPICRYKQCIQFDNVDSNSEICLPLSIPIQESW